MNENEFLEEKWKMQLALPLSNFGGERIKEQSLDTLISLSSYFINALIPHRDEIFGMLDWMGTIQEGEDG